MNYSQNIFTQILALIMPATIMITSILVLGSLNFLMSYPEFIVGFTSWSAVSKSQDLIIPVMVIFGFLPLYKIINRQIIATKSVLCEQDFTVIKGVRAFINLFLGFVILMLFSALMQSGLAWLEWKYALIFFSVLLLSGWVFLNFEKVKKLVSGCEFVAAILFLLCAAFCAPMAIFLAIERINPIISLDLLNKFLVSSAICEVAMLLFISRNFFLTKELQQRNFSRAFLVVQLPLALLFFAIIPHIYLDAKDVFVAYKIKALFYIVVAVLICFSIYDVIRKFSTTKAAPAKYLSGISAWIIAAVVIALKSGISSPPNLSPDDYHVGENLLSLWSITKWQMIPYVDYVHTHGLLQNDLPSLISWLFYDSKGVSFNDAYRVAAIVCTLLFFVFFYRFTGNLAFTAVMALTQLDSRFYNILCLIYFLIIFDHKLLEQKVKWCLWWLVLSAVIAIGAQSYGLIFVAASAPLFFLKISQTKIADWLQYKRALVVLVAVALGLLLLTPIFQIESEALTYVMQNTALNKISYGVRWNQAWNKSDFLALEIVRSSWMIGAIILLGFVWRNRSKNIAEIMPAIVVLLVALLMIPYTQGRIDPGSISRPGAFSDSLWIALIPLVFWHRIAEKTKFLLIIGCVFFSFALNQNNFFQLDKIFTAQRISEQVIDGSEIGLSNIGSGIVQHEQLQRLVKINRFLQDHLSADETYLDLTNRNANYFYLDRQPPVSITAFYNMVTLYHQQKAIESLERIKPKVAVLEAENITHDGIKMSLRAPLLFRYVMENYEPVYRDGIIYGVRKDSGIKNIESENSKLVLLTKAYATSDLNKLPLAWGKSILTLQDRMVKVADLNLLSKKMYGAQKISYDLSSLNLCPKDAGLLLLNFRSDAATKIKIEFLGDEMKDADAIFSSEFYANVKDNVAIVPLDSYPSWLALKKVKKIVISADEKITLQKVELAQRKIFLGN